MNEIVYTISRIPFIVNIRTANSTVDDIDREVISTESCLWMKMATLTEKYNKKGYAVLFEVD